MANSDIVEDTLSFSEELVLLPKLGEADFARPSWWRNGHTFVLEITPCNDGRTILLIEFLTIIVCSVLFLRLCMVMSHDVLYVVMSSEDVSQILLGIMKFRVRWVIVAGHSQVRATYTLTDIIA